MEQRNFEPLMILLVAGIFLVLLAGGIMHVFPKKQREAIIAKSFSVKTVDKKNQPGVNPDSLRAVLTDRDTVSSSFTGLDMFYLSIEQV